MLENRLSSAGEPPSCVRSILHQRSVYPEWSFGTKAAYDMDLKVTEDEELSAYLGTFLFQLKDWLAEGKVRSVVLVILSVESQEGLEMWTFDIDGGSTRAMQETRSVQEIRNDITAIMRQVMSCVTFLPRLKEKCTFDLLVHADSDTSASTDWEEAASHEIQNPSKLELLPFATNAHRLNAVVAYKKDLAS
ncbi:hypothetical protein BSKO_03581 [Bryopsis sp. KO-2023]|nr:hypothetical protein BSKO_03581 [Bryopsis sp. KO-2023]